MIKDKKYWIEIIVLLLFYTGHLLGIPFLRYAGMGTLAAMILVFDPDELIYTYALLLPNTYLIKLNTGGMAIAGYLMLVALVKLLFMRGSRWFALDMVMSLFLHVGVVAISILWNGDMSFVSALIRFCAQVMLGVLILSENVVSKDKLVSRYIAGNCFSIVLALIYNQFWGISNLSGQFSSIGNDRNYFAITAVCALAVHVVHTTVTSKSMLKNSIQTLLLLAAVVLSGSRTAFILLLIPAIVYVWSMLNISYRRKIYLVVLMVVIMVVLTSFLDEAMDNILGRFSSASMSGGNGRFEAWEFYIREVMADGASFLLGRGSSTSDMIYDGVEHNTFVQGMYTIGMLGLSTLIGVYATVMKHGLRGRKVNIAVLPSVAIIVGYCTINGLYSDNLTFAITLSMVTVQLVNEHNISIGQKR